jgi:hypothetical protein
MPVPAGISPQDRVWRAVLTRLLFRSPVDTASLSVTTGLPEAAVEEALAVLSDAGVIHQAGGIVVAAYPLSGVPTRHRLHVGGTTTYACCAIDALAIPFLVDGPVDLATECAECDESITVRMDGERVLAVAPESPIVFYVERGCCETGPAVITRCPHINFFCGAGHASRWLADHRELRGPLLGVPQAIAAARQQFDRAIRLVREGTF